MNEPKVSIIVPVYNVEKYLEKCLDSLINQSLRDIEILVINDGSPDHSQEIIQKYVELYPNKVFGYSKENGGLGDARNYGIDRAQGEYIGFVDSDDWVEPSMYEELVSTAVRTDSDIVICDFIEINDGWEVGKISNGYRGTNKKTIAISDYVQNSLNPAVAWNKLYRRSLFKLKKFPSYWYEDMATTPILISYASKVCYLPRSLYYYRQVQNSITKQFNDRRTLAVISAWKECLKQVNPVYHLQIESAVYQSVSAFLCFKPEFAQQFLDFLLEHKSHYSSNSLIQLGIRTGQFIDIFSKILIPKTIHYCWFGGQPKSDLIERCICSWKKYAPDFEIIEWNESNCDMHINEYVDQAYTAGKWAFVSDYFRLEKILQFGGIYLDTDTELTQPPHKLLLDEAFFAFETKNAVHAGIFGAIPFHPLIRSCMKSYSVEKFYREDGTPNTEKTIVKRIGDILQTYGLVFNGKEQQIKDGIHIYSANQLTLDIYDGKNIAQHHYACSWWSVTTGLLSYKNTVLRDIFSSNGQLSVANDEELLSQLEYYKSEFERLENSTSWKITAPLRRIADLCKKLLHR